MPAVHLVRHGVVSNPNHVVYADLDGFNLSPLGVRQAHAAARRLAHEPVDLVLSSPLARARQTATAIARGHGIDVTVDPRLTETGQYPAWTGRRWDELDDLFPGQVARYLEDASRLDDAEERLEDVAARVVAVIDAALATGHEAIVVVGHQDPTQATRLSMTGRPLSSLRIDPPPHCSVITLEPKPADTSPTSWRELGNWSPTERSHDS